MSLFKMKQQQHHCHCATTTLFSIMFLLLYLMITSSGFAFVVPLSGKKTKTTQFQRPHIATTMTGVARSRSRSVRSLVVDTALPRTPTTVSTTMMRMRMVAPTSTSTSTTTTSSQRDTALSSETRDDEIERLRGMAAQLRAEAAALEAQQALVQARAVETSFSKFDLNQDGRISVSELKQGLEKILKTELSEKRVQTLLENFDTSGDGTLQLSEFVTVDQLRNKLDALARDERQVALELAKKAKLEEEASKFIQAQLEIMNDKEPTAADRVLSILPYLFPLLDGLLFARFLVLENPDNPLSIAVSILFALYRSIPFGGFIAFFALITLSGNLRINRLIRFNMQQAIFLDVALFFPGLLAGVYSVLAQGLGLEQPLLPASVTELGSNAIFATLVAVIAYAVTSSLLGITPNQIPYISDAVTQRMPTMDMFDASGRFVGGLERNKRNEDDEEEDDDDSDVLKKKKEKEEKEEEKK